MRKVLLVVLVPLAAAAAFASIASADVKITDGPYVRHDGLWTRRSRVAAPTRPASQQGVNGSRTSRPRPSTL